MYSLPTAPANITKVLSIHSCPGSAGAHQASFERRQAGGGMEPTCLLQDLSPCIMAYVEIQVMGAHSTVCKRHKEVRVRNEPLLPSLSSQLPSLPVATVGRFFFFFGTFSETSDTYTSSDRVPFTRFYIFLGGEEEPLDKSERGE